MSSVFDLLGINENDLTSALGFTPARAPALLEAVIRRVWPGATAADLDAASLALEVRGDAGRTDLQITLPQALFIVEAKRDWLLPTADGVPHLFPPLRRRWLADRATELHGVPVAGRGSRRHKHAVHRYPGSRSRAPTSKAATWRSCTGGWRGVRLRRHAAHQRVRALGNHSPHRGADLLIDRIRRLPVGAALARTVCGSAHVITGSAQRPSVGDTGIPRRRQGSSTRLGRGAPVRSGRRR